MVEIREGLSHEGWVWICNPQKEVTVGPIAEACKDKRGC